MTTKLTGNDRAGSERRDDPAPEQPATATEPEQPAPAAEPGAAAPKHSVKPLPFTPKARVTAPAEVLADPDAFRFFAACDRNWRVKPTGGGYLFVAWLMNRGEKGATLAEAAKANHLAVHLRWDLERNADKLRWEPLPAKEGGPAPAGK